MHDRGKVLCQAQAQARARLDEFHEPWGGKYPAIKGLWDAVGGEFIPFLDHGPEIRRVIYSTKRRGLPERSDTLSHPGKGHLPNEEAAPKSTV